MATTAPPVPRLDLAPTPTPLLSLERRPFRDDLRALLEPGAPGGRW